MSEWTRQGECNNCGACCLFLFMKPGTMLIQVEAASGPKPEHQAPDNWHLSVRGLETTGNPHEYQASAWLFNPCREFDQRAYRCRIHPDKPQTCINWPWDPDQVANTPCSYYFERQDGEAIERIGGHGSAYPGSTVELGGVIRGIKGEMSPPFRGAGPLEEDDVLG